MAFTTEPDVTRRRAPLNESGPTNGYAFVAPVCPIHRCHSAVEFHIPCHLGRTSSTSRELSAATFTSAPRQLCRRSSCSIPDGFPCWDVCVWASCHSALLDSLLKMVSPRGGENVSTFSRFNINTSKKSHHQSFKSSKSINREVQPLMQRADLSRIQSRRGTRITDLEKTTATDKSAIAVFAA